MTLTNIFVPNVRDSIAAGEVEEENKPIPLKEHLNNEQLRIILRVHELVGHRLKDTYTDPKKCQVIWSIYELCNRFLKKEVKEEE